jgi:hypothetical protein
VQRDSIRSWRFAANDVLMLPLTGTFVVGTEARRVLHEPSEMTRGSWEGIAWESQSLMFTGAAQQALAAVAARCDREGARLKRHG